MEQASSGANETNVPRFIDGMKRVEIIVLYTDTFYLHLPLNSEDEIELIKGAVKDSCEEIENYELNLRCIGWAVSDEE